VSYQLKGSLFYEAEERMLAMARKHLVTEPAIQRILDLVRAGKTFDQIQKEHRDIPGTDLYKARQHVLSMIFDERPESILRCLNNEAGRLDMADPKRFAISDLAIHLKVSLDNVKPVVWRRLIVPGQMTLDLLHDVIQIAMGWTDHHLHVFEIDGRRYAADPESDTEGDEEHLYRIDAVLKTEGMTFTYEYDFGDGWHHTIVVERIEKLPANKTVIPTCVDGKRACPPENCGGPWSYPEFVKSLADPRHPAHKRNREWAPDFDPKRFDVDAVQLELFKHRHWSRHRWGAPIIGVL
jgi:hypothetical protein